LLCKLPNYYSDGLDEYAIDLIIMQTNLVPDSLAPLTLLFLTARLLDTYLASSWMGAILQYGRGAQFANFLLFLKNNLNFKNSQF